MDIAATTQRVAEKAAQTGTLGATVKFLFDAGTIYIDGNGGANTVSNSNEEADCEITLSIETLNSLMSGELNPVAAFMSGQMSVDGDMSVAMKLSSMFD